MFDVGFSELLVIAVVALLVIGPERLPKVARTAGHLFGRLQRYVNDVKADIQREMELEELHKVRAQFEEAARSIGQSVSEVDREVNAVGDDLTRSISGPASGETTPVADNASAPAPTPEAAPAPAAPVATPTASVNEAKI
jgi:sec-independent protein translocase protein TatB